MEQVHDENFNKEEMKTTGILSFYFINFIFFILSISLSLMSVNFQ